MGTSRWSWIGREMASASARLSKGRHCDYKIEVDVEVEDEVEDERQFNPPEDDNVRIELQFRTTSRKNLSPIGQVSNPYQLNGKK